MFCNFLFCWLCILIYFQSETFHFPLLVTNFVFCFPFWARLIVWLWILITQQPLIIPIDSEINELSLSDWLDWHKAIAHCPLCISQWESPFSNVPHANQSINHARHNSGYWLYIIYIVYAFALALYTDHILIKIVYAPFPPLRTVFSLCNSCQNGPINCAACNSMSIELVKGINCRMKCKHTHKHTHTHGHYNWPPCIEIRQHVFMARDCETVGNLMILQVQNILPAMRPINQPHSPILYRIAYLCKVYM